MAKKWTYSATKAGYAAMWNSIVIKGGQDLINATFFARKIIANETRYRLAGLVLGVPWYFIGALHMRESGCDFNGVLHNGDKIIGTGKLTYRVPKGRGPFATWEDAAADAMRLKKFEQYRGNWCPSLMGFVSELFNGTGYIGKGVNSAYLWAGSNHEQTGKYVADHVWDGRFDDPQIGTMTVLKRIAEMRPDVAKELVEKKMSTTTKVVVGGTITAGAGTGAVVATQPTTPPVAPPVETTSTITDVAKESGEVLSTIVPMLTGWTGAFAIAFGVALIVGFVGYQYYKRRLD